MASSIVHHIFRLILSRFIHSYRTCLFTNSSALGLIYIFELTSLQICQAEFLSCIQRCNVVEPHMSRHGSEYFVTMKLSKLRGKSVGYDTSGDRQNPVSLPRKQCTHAVNLRQRVHRFNFLQLNLEFVHEIYVL